MYNNNEMIKLFGFPFYFAHGTHVVNLPSILKNEELNFSSEVENSENIRKDWGGGEYTYCFSIFKEFPMPSISIFRTNLIINPQIMFEHIIIFNSGWIGKPYMTKEKSEENINNIIKCIKKDKNKITLSLPKF